MLLGKMGETMKVTINLYIMTSDENFFDIKNFWKQNKFFGLS
jgi:UDP-N-acetylglucosamine pyrophosphorylase